MFAVGVSLLKGPPKCSAEVLPGVFKYKKAAMCLIEKISLSDKLYLGKSYSAIGFEFNEMNKPYILNKVFLNRNACKTRLCIEQLTKMLKPEACRILNLHYPKEQGLLVQCSWQVCRTKLP